ncbi:transglutaminaseTgpA domain-containing protein [Cryobacterium psychrophilum]|uniref:Transglutaminase-like domain-containing protein n=1 Tax=Cryobacterium psychrophilum TaxID=41988 RepID=A0A4Y8KMS7_9MICO|nr:DUF3488 and transglutaminase-like domain-containing protein [Cryobacterium psychrophilum]TDW31194.1 transglutaminase-like putative cysteine protease [Cryobacterium psychrophilum]TFD78515.1 hypothetical protein E3T53_10005 [Cryobacterium psychrophilum]
MTDAGPAAVAGRGGAPFLRGRGTAYGARKDANWPFVATLLALLLVASGALGPLLRGTSWWWVMSAVAIIVLLLGALLPTLRVARPVLPLWLLGGLLLTLTLFFGAGTALLWIVPTPATARVFSGLVASGVDSIWQQSVPAQVTDGILFLLAAGAGLIAVLMHTLAVTLRTPALAGVPVLVPLLVPGAIVAGPPNVMALVVTSAVYLVLLRVDVRHRRAADANHAVGGGPVARVFVSSSRRRVVPVWGTLSAGAVALVAALVLGLVVPSVTGNDPRSGSNALLFGSGVSPMINLGQDLRRPKAGPVLHYTSTAERQSYFTLLTLDSLVGQTWTARIDGVRIDNSVENIDRPPGVSEEVETTLAETSVVIDGVNTRWLPVPARTVKVTGLTGVWYWDTRTRAVASADASTIGQTYIAEALELRPTAEQMRQAGSEYSSVLARNLDVPSGMPTIIEDRAREVTAGTTSSYDAAVALQGYLNGSAFTYDTESPVEEGYDGGGLDVVGVFLEKKRGYCVHFASAMASMARSLGIPSRISLGYLPGVKSQDLEQGRGRYDVDSHDLHSWPELYFSGVGWVPFEPTPGRGTVPDYEQAATTDTTTGATNETAPSAAAREPVDPGAVDLQASGATSSPTRQAGTVLGQLASLALGLLLLLLVPAGVRAVQHRARHRRIRSGTLTRQQAVLAAWGELCDTVLDYGITVRVTETPRMLRDRLCAVIGEESAAAVVLARLCEAVERARYDRGSDEDGTVDEAVVLSRELGEMARRIHVSVGRGARWRAVLLPRSLILVLWLLLNGRSPRNA